MTQPNNPDKKPEAAQTSEGEMVVNFSFGDQPINWLYQKITGAILPKVQITKDNLHSAKRNSAIHKQG